MEGCLTGCLETSGLLGVNIINGCVFPNMVDDMQWYLPSPAESSPSPYPTYYGDTEMRAFARIERLPIDIIRTVESALETIYHDAATRIAALFRGYRVRGYANDFMQQIRVRIRENMRRPFVFNTTFLQNNPYVVIS